MRRLSRNRRFDGCQIVTDHTCQSQSRPKAQYVLLAFRQLSFSLQRLGQHLVALSDGQSRGLKNGKGKRVFLVPREHGKRSGQPVFENADATEAAFIQVFPVVHQIRWFRQGKMPREGV